MASRGWRRYRIPREYGPFFLYLRVVRGHSVRYAAKLARALGHKSGVDARTARRYYEDFLSEWWVHAEEVVV